MAKALAQAKSQNVDFVIGLGDYTNLGTIDELSAAKKVFDESGLAYYVIPGDRDGWDSRQRGEANTFNFAQVFGSAEQNEQTFSKNGVQFVLVDNSDIYSLSDLSILSNLSNLNRGRLVFVFAHKTPFHPDSSHIMGEDSAAVARQAKEFLELLEKNRVDGFFAGDMHFFARFSATGGSPKNSVKITTVGAVAQERNFQGPRFAVLKVYEDYSWEVEDLEIK